VKTYNDRSCFGMINAKQGLQLYSSMWVSNFQRDDEKIFIHLSECLGEEERERETSSFFLLVVSFLMFWVIILKYICKDQRNCGFFSINFLTQNFFVKDEKDQ